MVLVVANTDHWRDSRETGRLLDPLQPQAQGLQHNIVFRKVEYSKFIKYVTTWKAYRRVACKIKQA